jgi:Na+-transporting methylmalonyl-CoA/oxaloacetate decarboxylase gamma subunit
MGIELLLTGVFFLLVLGLLAALIYSMSIISGRARMSNAQAKDAQGQKRFLTASILNFIVQK